MDGEVPMPGGQQALNMAAQTPAIAMGVGKPVDMVNAQTVNQASGNQLEDLAVAGCKYLGQLGAQGDQLVHIKEAPPVDVVIGGAPTGQAVVLLLQQFV